jgi:hypothetical protein
LLAVRARSDVVENGVFVGVLGLCLLQLLHQVGCVGVAFLVGRVEARRDDLLHHVEAYCCCQYSYWMCVSQALHQYVTIGLNFSSCAARFANGASCRLLSFAGTVSPMVAMRAAVMCAGRGGGGVVGVWELQADGAEDAVIWAGTPATPHRAMAASAAEAKEGDSLQLHRPQ